MSTTAHAMHDSEYTLTSPMATVFGNKPPVLCATIVWHPDPQRIGEQYLAAGNTLELSRYRPLFQRPGGRQAGLSYSGISREPVRITRDGTGNIDVNPPNSRMVVELNGEEVREPRSLSPKDVQSGVIIALGRSVLLCLHWMCCLPKDVPVPGLIGVGDSAICIREQIGQVARSEGSVLLLGETGTGKEIVARAIHAMSVRAGRPMVTVNMAALNEALAAAELFGAARGAYTGAQQARTGLFAEARQATLFLDEIGNAPAAVQPMLLRVLETGDYRPLGATADLRSEARVIAATDQDLYGGSFNQALLRRLESLVIALPPLRARREDIGILLLHMLGHDAARSIPATLVSLLALYHWPGNVRQLRHVANRILLAIETGATPDIDRLLAKRPEPHEQETAHAQRKSGEPTDSFVRARPSSLSEEAILAAMDDHGWTIQTAARALGISRPSLYKLLEAHPQVRRADQIGQDELLDAFHTSGGDIAACASQLRTPSEALRRHLRSRGLC